VSICSEVLIDIFANRQSTRTLSLNQYMPKHFYRILCIFFEDNVHILGVLRIGTTVFEITVTVSAVGPCQIDLRRR